jgi:hypothetical protein
MRSFITCTLDQVKEDEMDRACSTKGGGMHIGFWWEIQKEGDH